MKPTSLYEKLTESLESILGSKIAERISSELEIQTVGQLLNYRPRRWLERGELTVLDKLVPGELATVISTISRISPPRRTGRGVTLTKLLVGDDQLAVTFFNNRWIHTKVALGDTVMLHGKVSTFNGQLQLTNPQIDVEPGEQVKHKDLPGPEPLYPATAALPSWRIKKIIATVLEAINLTEVQDVLEQELIDKLGLLPLSQAFLLLHQPTTMADAQQAVQRLALHEALMIQVALKQQSKGAKKKESIAFPSSPQELRDAFDAELPFELTQGQNEIGERLSSKIDSQVSMNVLLQGEVGSGKTIVAVRAMLQVIQGGGQVALLAPTEVLAGQHFRSIKAMLSGLKIGNKHNTFDFDEEQPLHVTLLTGGAKTAVKRQTHLDIVTGTADIVVGTHALLSEGVDFYNLGLVVVDEQHRFGVAQRAALRERYDPMPHLLIMSATPIPRSIALTAFGDLEFLELQGVPSNRAEVHSQVVNMGASPTEILNVWKTIIDAVQQGRQGYIICPKITPTSTEIGEAVGKDEDIARRQDAAVEVLLARLQTLEMFSNIRLGMLHGQMSSADKERVMADFERHRIDVLISTTVVEVGVDVPNATVMAVLDADYFGISTLHQLRGRIRRSQHPGSFLMVHRRDETDPASTISLRRLNVVAEHTDGMKLAIEDLHLRKEGDILGLDQSGRGSSLRYLRLLQDQKLIEKASTITALLIGEESDAVELTDLSLWVELWRQDYATEYLQQG